MDERTIARFWSKVDKSAGPDGCWLWTASTRMGYGNLRVGRRVVSAHRISWELANGPIERGDGYHGTCVLHRCDNPPCCNPAHLSLGSQQDNIRDRDAKGRGVLIPPCLKGEDSGRAILTEVDVRSIRARASAGESHRSLAVAFGIGKTTVGSVVTRLTWAHVM